MKILKVKSILFSLLAVMAVAVFMTSCEQETFTPEQIELEQPSEKDWWIEAGYVPLEDNHLLYQEIIEGLDDRAKTCRWKGRPAFSCNGGNCLVYVPYGPVGAGSSACLVCVGGSDHGNSDCP